MALALRLASKGIRSQLLVRSEKCGLLNFVRPVTLKSIQATAPASETYDELNARLGRPQSPHLFIYKPQLTTMLSISHRTTGIILSGYAAVLGIGALALPLPVSHYIEALEALHLSGSTIFIGKFMLAFPLAYHFWNGVRFLLFDAGRFLTLKQIYFTGYVILALSTATGIGLSLM